MLIEDERQQPKLGTPERAEYDYCNNLLWHATGGAQLGWQFANKLTWLLVDERARMQKQIAEQKLTIELRDLQVVALQTALAESEALVMSHEGHIERLNTRIAGITEGAAKVRDQLAYHLGRNSRLAAGYKRLRRAAEYMLTVAEGETASNAVHCGLNALQKAVNDRSAFIDDPQVHWNQKED